MFAPALHPSQRAPLLFFQDHSSKAGKGAVPVTDLRSLSPVRWGTWHPHQAKWWERRDWGMGVGWGSQHWHPWLVCWY